MFGVFLPPVAGKRHRHWIRSLACVVGVLYEVLKRAKYLKPTIYALLADRIPERVVVTLHKRGL